MVDIDALRSAYRDSSSGDEAGHITEDQWQRLACDDLEADERQPVLDHILECPHCSDTYRALQILRTGATSFDESAPTPKTVLESTRVRRFPWRGLGVLAMAATVVLVVVLPLQRAQDRAGSNDTVVVRSTGEETTVTPVSPLGAVSWATGEDLVMKWSAGESVVFVIVEILDADAELIWTSEKTTACEVMWPADEIPGFGSFYWQVLVRDRSAGVVDSELVSFNLVGQ